MFSLFFNPCKSVKSVARKFLPYLFHFCGRACRFPDCASRAIRKSMIGTNGKSIRGYALRRAVPANATPAKSR